MKIEINNLVRVNTFAVLYGKQKRGAPVSRQHIEKLIETFKIPAKYVVTIDKVKFVNTEALNELSL